MTAARTGLDQATRWWAMTLGLVLAAVDVADCWASIAADVTAGDRDVVGARVVSRYYRYRLTRYGHPQHPQIWPVTVTATDPVTGASDAWSDAMLVRTDTVYLDPGADRFARFLDAPAVAWREPGQHGCRSEPLGTVEVTTPTGAQLVYRSSRSRPSPAVGDPKLDALVAALETRHRHRWVEQRRAGEPMFGFAAGLELLEQLRAGRPSQRFSHETSSVMSVAEGGERIPFASRCAPSTLAGLATPQPGGGQLQ